jgi:hypothetical protein
MAIDYFTKWVEAALFSVLKAKHVDRFIESNIICRYGVPHEIISDNGMHFEDTVQRFLQKYGVKYHKLSPYRPQTNGGVGSANKNVKVILEKTTERYRDWADKLPFALWGYCTSIRTSTGMTPYSLVYGMEVVLSAEIEVKSLRIILESQILEAEWVKTRYEQLIFTDEKRLKVLYHVQGYQRGTARAFNKKVKPRNLKEGDLVLKELRAPVFDPRRKFKPNWAGPYVIKTLLSGGAVNLDRLRKYYV